MSKRQPDEEVKGLPPLEQPRRFFGQRTNHGYVRVGPIEDQEFSLAPGRQQSWSSIRDEEQALDHLLEHVNDYVRGRMLSVVRRRREWWDDTMGDFAVNQNTHEASTNGLTVSVRLKASKLPTTTKPMSSTDEAKVE